jgi:hypothetical protein
MKPGILVLSFILTVCKLSVEGAVVVGTNVLLDNDGNGNWTLTAVHENGSYSSLVFGKTELGPGMGSSLTPSAWTVDTEADYYVVPANTPFAAATIASGQFSPFFTLDNPRQINVPYGDFYLAINTGQSWLSPQVPARDEFGWVELDNTRTGLVMVDNAMAYGVGGIVVGTYDTIAIPESTCWGVEASIIALCLLLRKGKEFHFFQAWK